MHQDTFNANFYIIASTIIPVLFLALVLQGSTYEQLLANWLRMVKNAAKNSKLIAWALDFASYIIAIFVLLSGFLGELRATFALYDGRASASTGQFVLFSVIVLLVVATFGPAAGLVRTMSMTDEFLRDPKKRERSTSDQFKSPDGEGAEGASSDE
jgi:hypothetical protein